jgi:hypothetical protein
MYDGRADSLPSVPPGREPRRCSAVVPRPSGGMRYIGGVCRRARSPSIITGCGDETNPRILSFRLGYLRVCTFWHVKDHVLCSFHRRLVFAVHYCRLPTGTRSLASYYK